MRRKVSKIYSPALAPLAINTFSSVLETAGIASFRNHKMDLLRRFSIKWPQ